MAHLYGWRLQKAQRLFHKSYYQVWPNHTDHLLHCVLAWLHVGPGIYDALPLKKKSRMLNILYDPLNCSD